MIISICHLDICFEFLLAFNVLYLFDFPYLHGSIISARRKSIGVCGAELNTVDVDGVSRLNFYQKLRCELAFKGWVELCL